MCVVPHGAPKLCFLKYLVPPVISVQRRLLQYFSTMSFLQDVFFFFMFAIERQAPPPHTHTRMKVFTKQVFATPLPSTSSAPTPSRHSFGSRLERGGGGGGGHVLLEGTTQTAPAPAITIKKEQINFGGVSLCSRHG